MINKVKNLGNSEPLSRYQLLFFALVFAAVPAYFLLHSFAASPSQTIFLSPTGNDSTCAPEQPNNPCLTLNQALSKISDGDKIQLADGGYAQLTSSGKNFASPVTIQGSRNARMDGITINDSSSLILEGVTITPLGIGSSNIVLKGTTHDVTIDGILLSGSGAGDIAARVDIGANTSNLTIQNSEITNCGREQNCVTTGKSQNLRILNNNFHDCLSCDFIAGNSRNVTIQGNVFDRAIPHDPNCTTQTCNHNDQIQIMGGGPWNIIGNRFGLTQLGQIILVQAGRDNTDDPIHGVLFQSNIFASSYINDAVDMANPSRYDPDLGYYRTIVASPEGYSIRVLNNSIVNGSIGPTNSSITINGGDGDPQLDWANYPQNERPQIINNIMLANGGGGLCNRGDFISNLVESKTPCASDILGAANLDGNQFPTSLSTLVIGKAATNYAPTTDFFGLLRVGLPDLGAVEYRGAPPPKQGDINGDGKIDVFDLSILLSQWGKAGTGDLNSDGVVNITDLSILLSKWGT